MLSCWSPPGGRSKVSAFSMICLLLLILTPALCREEFEEDDDEEDLLKFPRSAKEQREPEKQRIGEICEFKEENKQQNSVSFYSSAEGKQELKRMEKKGSDLCQSMNCKFDFSLGSFLCVESIPVEGDDSGDDTSSWNNNGKGNGSVSVTGPAVTSNGDDDDVTRKPPRGVNPDRRTSVDGASDPQNRKGKGGTTTVSQTGWGAILTITVIATSLLVF